MAQDPPAGPGPRSPEERLEEAIASYLEEVDAGKRPDPEEIIRRNPDLAPDLREFFEGQGELALLGRGLSGMAPASARPGDTFGDYEIISEIARGGMGVVYRARQRSLKRAVALKMILAGTLASEEEVRRFRHEAEAGARLDHPNIVPIYEIGELQGHHYFSMKLVEGGSLEEKRASLRGNPRAVAGTIEAVARAVHFAHEHGVLHRDLKPANILLDAEGKPHITDFGLAKALDPASSMHMTRTGTVVGTLVYMAPEQASPGKAELGPPVDVYSLGAVLYDLLTGRPPLVGATPGETLRKVVEEDPRPARAIEPRVPRDLDTIASKCLEKDPKDRYGSAAGLADDLARFLAHEPILARPPGIARRAWKLIHRHPVAGAAAVAALAVAALLGGLAWHRSESSYREALRSAGEALSAKDLPGARRSLAFLQQAHGGRAAVSDLAGRVAEEERQALIEESRRLREQGEAQVTELHRIGAELESLERRRGEAEKGHAGWEGPWDRRDEIEARSRLKRRREEMDACYDRAILLLSRAAETAPPGADEIRRSQRALEDLYYERYSEARERGSVGMGPGFFMNLIESLDLGTYAAELKGGGRVSIATEPGGSDVYCFRYESREERLLPIPFDPARGAASPAEGLLADPFLEVERIWDAALSPFEAGDRLLSAGGRDLRLLGDLAEALRGIPADAAVDCAVLRAGKRVSLSWIPYPSGRDRPAPENLLPGRLFSTREQFGFTVAGYPLEFHPGARVGTTGTGSSLEFDLPRGSYLLILRKEGYADVRFPVAMPRKGSRDRVRLLRPDEIPPGFVYVPAGAFPYGGDREAFQSLEAGEKHLEGFFLGRLEVTVGEYLEFVNDPEVLAGIDDGGKREPISGEARRELDPGGKVQLIPWDEGRGKTSWEKRDGKWVAPARWSRDWPVLDVSLLCAHEYARWRTGKGRWRYRVPTDLEWEKGARGCDRRIHVWGDDLIWSYCWSNRGSRRRPKTPETAGCTPTDESVFGARDMAGSVNEATSSNPVEGFRLRSLRGGDWLTIDAYLFRIATRNSRLPEVSARDTGFRLVAELPDP